MKLSIIKSTIFLCGCDFVLSWVPQLLTRRNYDLNRLFSAGRRSGNIDESNTVVVNSDQLSRFESYSKYNEDLDIIQDIAMEFKRIDIPPNEWDVQLLAILSENDVLEAAELCIDVFFPQPSNVFQSLHIDKLVSKLNADILSRYRSTNLLPNAMVKAVDAEGDIVGFVEISLAAVDVLVYEAYLNHTELKPLNVIDGTVYLPKIGNLAVSPSVRNQGIGLRLMQSCHQIATLWGFDQVILQVDSDNEIAKKVLRFILYYRYFIRHTTN